MNNTRRSGSRNIRWKQRFSHPCPRPGFAFFVLLFFPFQWRGRIVSEWSCSAQPASINLWLFSSIWLIVYAGEQKGNDGKSDCFHAVADGIPLLSRCDGAFTPKSTSAAGSQEKRLSRRSMLIPSYFSGADFVFLFRLVWAQLRTVSLCSVLSGLLPTT